MPGERNIVLRDDATSEILETDRGTGVHPAILEDPGEIRQEPITKEDDTLAKSSTKPQQTMESELDSDMDAGVVVSECIDPERLRAFCYWAVTNRRMRRSKKAVPVYSCTSDCVRVTTACQTNSKQK